MLDVSQLSFDFGAPPAAAPFRSLRELGEKAGQGQGVRIGTEVEAGAGDAAREPTRSHRAPEPSPTAPASSADPACLEDSGPACSCAPGAAHPAGSHVAFGPTPCTLGTGEAEGDEAALADLAEADADDDGEEAATASLPPYSSPADAPQPRTQPVRDGRDMELEDQGRGWLHALDMPGGARLLTVTWNARLRSTAGYARYPSWAIELNPLLAEFEGQVERTLKHELAHLIAYHRAGRRRIEPHGREWRAACADLGIPDEKAHHRLALPRNVVERKLTYACPACQTPVHRVRKFRRPTACLHCCNRYAGGQYDGRFRLVLVGG